MLIDIRTTALSPWQLISEYEQSQRLQGKYGATAVFVGTMRDLNDDESIQAMHLEHYPGMTDKYLQDLAAQAIQKWQLLDVFIVHRVGEVKPGDTIVLVATWSAHRAHAYEANRYLMEELKSHAPFWKKEQLTNGDTRWVEKNTPGKL